MICITLLSPLKYIYTNDLLPREPIFSGVGYIMFPLADFCGGQLYQVGQLHQVHQLSDRTSLSGRSTVPER